MTGEGYINKETSDKEIPRIKIIYGLCLNWQSRGTEKPA